VRWALAWVLLAAAITLSGRRAARHDEPRAHPRRMSRRALGLCGAAAVTVALVALGGLAVGGVTALVLAPLAGVLLGRLADRPPRSHPDGSLALALDLTAAALRSGQPLAAALALTAPTLSSATCREWSRVAGLLALGADPEQAWSSLAHDPVLAPVAMAARRTADSGARLARAFTQTAAEIRASIHAAALARAHRAGVLAMAPLGLCFLPAFICLGIVPTIAGIAGDVLAGVP
jgi:Flp pilus assembly protein TadB